MKAEKKQFNVRLTHEQKQTAVVLADAAGLTNEGLVETALAALIGTADEMLIAQQKKVRRLASELNLSFEQPEHQLAGLAA